jgi:hypothetical protein
MAVNSNFDTLTTTTLKNYRKTLEDNVFTANPLFYWLKEKNRMKVDNTGGTQIICPLMYGKNSTAKSYSGYDVIDIIPQDGLSAAEYDWKQYAVGITISGIEEFKNQGEARMINLLETKIKQAELSLIDLMADDLFKATGSVGANDLVSIPQLVSADGTGTVGNIVAGTYTWWKNYFVSGASTSVAYENIIPKSFDCILNASKGNDRPDVGICPSAVFLALESQLVKTINFIPQLKNMKAAEFGYDNYVVKGVTLMYDENCTAAQIFYLNTKYISLVTGAGKDFVSTPWIKPDNGDYKTSMILWYGNMVCSNRARQGVVVTIT